MILTNWTATTLGVFRRPHRTWRSGPRQKWISPRWTLGTVHFWTLATRRFIRNDVRSLQRSLTILFTKERPRSLAKSRQGQWLRWNRKNPKNGQTLGVKCRWTSLIRTRSCPEATSGGNHKTCSHHAKGPDRIVLPPRTVLSSTKKRSTRISWKATCLKTTSTSRHTTIKSSKWTTKK